MFFPSLAVTHLCEKWGWNPSTKLQHLTVTPTAAVLPLLLRGDEGAVQEWKEEGVGMEDAVEPQCMRWGCRYQVSEGKEGGGGTITVSQQRKMEGGGRSCRVEIMGGKPIAGKRKDNTETPLGEEVGGKWDIKQRYNINVNVTYANRCSPILFRAVNFIWIIQGQSGRLIKTRFYQHVTPGRFSWKPFRKHINTTKTIVATKGHHWQVKEVQSVRENSLEVRSSSPPNPLPRPSQMAMAIVHYHKHQTCKKQLFWQLDTEQNGGISLWLVGFWTSHNRNAFHEAFTSWFNSKQRHLYGL